jgi:phosphopentomutase
VGKPGSFERTKDRKDFTVKPFAKTVLEDLVENDYPVKSVGKIHQIFSGIGIMDSFKSGNNKESIRLTRQLIGEDDPGLIFTNLVDFDMKYGHRNDPGGYAEALREWDQGLSELLEDLNEDDILIVTADHGTDPTTDSTDHSREYVPLLVYGPSMTEGVDLGIRMGFDDIGQTILDYLGLPTRLNARSFLSKLIS